MIEREYHTYLKLERGLSWISGALRNIWINTILM